MANNRPVLDFETEMAMLLLDRSIDLYFSSCGYSTGYKHIFGNTLLVLLGTNPFIVLFSHQIKNLWVFVSSMRAIFWHVHILRKYGGDLYLRNRHFTERIGWVALTTWAVLFCGPVKMRTERHSFSWLKPCWYDQWTPLRVPNRCFLHNLTQYHSKPLMAWMTKRKNDKE